MHPQLLLYNSMTRKKDLFTSIKKNTVTMYNCGPTVYHDQHIGNFRTAITVDLLKRTLLHAGYRVKHITNITDVGHLTDDVGGTGEDRMELGARREGLTALQVARKYEALYKKDLRHLNIISPTKWTRATEHIRQQIALVKKLEARGYTYRTGDGIYFDTSRFSAYGTLAGLKRVSLRAGARVALGEKKYPTDFALWKFSPTDSHRQMEWKSPWGVGFPGWHIECSAMAMEHLGPTIDIHCGGIDLIPVHHTNEIAQAECVTGKPFVHFWVHSAFVLEGEEKMAKSKGNVKTLAWISDQGCSPMDYRYATLQTHYRKEMSVTGESVRAARAARQQLITAVVDTPRRGGHVLRAVAEQFESAMFDDLNAPRALAVLWDIVRGSHSPADKRATLLHADAVLGLGLAQEKKSHRHRQQIPTAVSTLLVERGHARARQEWHRSDELRDQIASFGFDVVDSPHGQRLKPRSLV